MTVATRTITTLAANWTQSQLTTAINTAMVNAGFTSSTGYSVSGTNYLSYNFSSGSGVNNNTVYRIAVTTGLAVSHQLFSTLNTGTNVGTNGSGEQFSTIFVSSQPITFHALNAFPEYRAVLMVQGSVSMLLGVFNPTNKTDVWSLESWNHAFIASSFTAWVSTSNNPFSNTAYTPKPLGDGNLASPATAFNASTVDAGLRIYTNSNQGCWTQTSSDIAAAPTNSRSRGDTFTPVGTNDIYLVVGVGNGGLVLKVSS
ncbi:hypothetical protein I8748_16470 [Nostoc sp. CENA67]|uniref:Uncharacterized protein n=1 Tax=Amazonocrinis nigriterrae CENA67 TaxID=2794033 RepID=A0A8J7LBK1_9NOST|nr:hypothetical protein [Amazonocrinis nigriterrae]MBH8563766.1 hypothetical protein [Amazonocrinis nigriterrae CENA67]